MIITPTTHLLKLADVAAELSVGERTVQNWIYEKNAPLGSFVKGSVRRVSLQDLTKFVLLNTLNPHRPDWLTAAIESDFRRMLREEMQAMWLEQQRRQGDQIERAA